MLCPFTRLACSLALPRSDPRIYQSNHKEHHSYTNELTALVLFHGTLLDDFLMPATTTLGGFVYVLLLSLVGLEAEAASNLVVYL